MSKKSSSQITLVFPVTNGPIPQTTEERTDTMEMLQPQEPLMQPIFLNRKEYRTSHFLHRDYQANSPHGGKFQRHDNFIRVLKNIEAFDIYKDQQDVIIFESYKKAMGGSTNLVELNKNKALHDAFKAVSYKTLILVNATIQVALSHHLDDEESKKLSVAANTATARQLTGKGALPTELAQRTCKAILEIAKMMGTPLHIALETAVKQAFLDTGVDLHTMLTQAAGMEKVEPAEMMLEPTNLAQRLGIGAGLSGARKMNDFLSQIGWQRKPFPKADWQLTSAGYSHATSHPWYKENGKTGYNFKWNVEAVRNELRRRKMLPPTVA